MVYLSTYKTGYKGAVNTLAALIITTKVVAIMTDSNVSNSVEQGKEIWKDIEGYDGMYQVSNKGNVRSFNNSSHTYQKQKDPNILSKNKLPNGYLFVSLYNCNHKQKNVSIHRLVAKAFITNRDDKPCVNHIDSDITNNDIGNLEWCTHKENTRHGMDHGFINQNGEDNQTSKLTNNDALDIRNAYRLGCFSQRELARAYDVCQTTIGKLLRKETWKHI